MTPAEPMPCASAIKVNEFVLAAFGFGHTLPDDAEPVLDLCVQLFYFPGPLFGCGEDGARVPDGLVLPQTDLARMNVVLGGDFVENFTSELI